MSANKDKVRLGDQAVEDAEHSAHDGHEAHRRRFARGAQPGIERAEDGIAADGGDRGHVKDLSHNGAAAAHMASASALATVAGERRHADQRGEFGRVDLPELGHIG